MHFSSNRRKLPAILWLGYETMVYVLLYHQPLTCGGRIISVQHSHYHGCWCPDSLRRQDISTRDIDYVE